MKDLLCSINVNAQLLYEHSVVARYATDYEQCCENLFWLNWYLQHVVNDLQKLKTQMKKEQTK